MVEYLDTDKVLKYLKILDNATTVKVGYFFSQTSESLTRIVVS